jgi:hypothetical protein
VALHSFLICFNIYLPTAAAGVSLAAYIFTKKAPVGAFFLNKLALETCEGTGNKLVKILHLLWPSAHRKTNMWELAVESN